MTADQILQKHEDANEMYFHQVDREFIIQAMKEYATSSQTEISDEEIEEQSWGYREVTKDINIPPNEDWSNGAKWYREQLKQKQ